MLTRTNLDKTFSVGWPGTHPLENLYEIDPPSQAEHSMKIKVFILAVKGSV